MKGGVEGGTMPKAGDKTAIERRQVQLDVEAPVTGARRRMTFNRFSLQRCEKQMLMHFGYVDEGGFLYDLLTCAMSAEDLERCKNRLMDYLGRTGPVLGGTMPKWQPPFERRNVEICSFLHMARSGDMAEIMLCHFSMTGMLRETREKAGSGNVKITPDVVAILSCPLSVQQQLILGLYAEPEQGGETC
jgi:hypothetical protein